MLKIITLNQKTNSMKCSNCGTNVGCGCNLVNGLCGYCRGIKKRTKQLKNAVTKTFKLSKLFGHNDIN